MLKLMSKDDIPDIPEEELEMAIEDFTGKPTPGQVVDRIKALEKRITYLHDQLAGLTMCENPSAEASKRVAHDLAKARTQLQHYQTLHQGRN
jgi:Cu/Ag efflux protein CusF